jgi:hypothetical protein
VVDVALLAGLALELPAVETLPGWDAELVVALQAGVLVDALAGAVAVTAVLVALERGVPLGERTGREELRNGSALEPEHDAEDAEESEQRELHSKIQRNP